eukprot:Gb_39575 [translate_table: standard]
MPWHFALRDLLQFSNDIQSVKSYLNNIQRTCPILVGIGSASDKEFFLIGDSADAVEVYGNSNFSMRK